MSPHLTGSIRLDCNKVLQERQNLLTGLKGDTLLVTGGTGFVGTWLAEMVSCMNDDYGFNIHLYLLSRSTDRFKMTTPHLANRKDISLIKSDVRYSLEVPKETNRVIHAAGNPDNRTHSSNPTETMSVIADGTSSVIRAVYRCSNLKNFLCVSSGLVYGPQPLTLDRIPETYTGAFSPGDSAAPYAEAKRFSETLCSAARSQEKLPVVTARPFAFLGPYQSLTTPWAINNFIHDVLTSNFIRVMGDGQTVRSYMYASDMASLVPPHPGSRTDQSRYNVGSPDGITLEKLAGLVADRFNPKPEIRLRASSKAHTTRFVPDIELANKILGLSLTVPLEEALTRTIEWNSSQQSSESYRQSLPSFH
jgi:nucleoside-diphosphate-sugar epimerase